MTWMVDSGTSGCRSFVDFCQGSTVFKCSSSCSRMYLPGQAQPATIHCRASDLCSSDRVSAEDSSMRHFSDQTMACSVE